MLLVILAGDQGRDVERQPVQVNPMATTGDLGHIGRPQIVDVKLHGLLRILGFYMHMLDRKGHHHSPWFGPCSRRVLVPTCSTAPYHAPECDQSHLMTKSSFFAAKLALAGTSAMVKSRSVPANQGGPEWPLAVHKNRGCP